MTRNDSSTVVIVEDDGAVASALAMLFEVLGYRTVVGTDAARVLASSVPTTSPHS